MGFLANLRIRSKLLIALALLAVMVVVAAVYSSIEIKAIDTRYSELIDHDMMALNRALEGQALTMRFGLFLYQTIAESDPDHRQVIQADLDKTDVDYRAVIADVMRESPERAGQIKVAQSLFEQALAGARPVRAAALSGDRAKAMQLMRTGVEAELHRSRQAMIDLVDDLRKSVDRQSDALTARTHRTILITWLVIGFGLVISFTVAFYIVQTEIVSQLMSLRGSIQDVADRRLNQPIPYLDVGNEIGEMSRALRTLQRGARERETQSWVKSEVATTVQRLQSAEDFGAFARILLSRISESIELVYGALYLADESHSRFARVGGFAVDGPGEPREVALGEGLVGQAAVERRPLAITTDNGDQVRISAGIGTVAPRNLLFVPVVTQDAVAAVIELAPAAPLTERQQALLDALMPSVALSAEILSGNIATRKLLEQTRAQAESGRFRTSDRRAQGRAGEHQPGAGGDRGRIAPRQRSGGRSHQDQIRFPRQHEPRNPHADERHHRHVAPGVEDRPESPAEGLRQENTTVRPASAGHHQRHSGFLQDRGGQTDGGKHRLRSGEGAREREQSDLREGLRQGPGTDLRHRPGGPHATRRATRCGWGKS